MFWGTFLELHARFWSHWVPLKMTPAVTPESKPTFFNPSAQFCDKCSLFFLASIVLSEVGGVKSEPSAQTPNRGVLPCGFTFF